MFKTLVALSTLVQALSLISIDFTQVKHGEITRDKNDRAYTAVIKNFKGFEKFKKQYAITWEAKEEDFKDSLYLVGFSDNYNDIEVDAFKQRESRPSYYYLDIVETGLEKQRRLPAPKGKKYSAYVVVRVSKDLSISHVQIREGVQDRLTIWFDDK